MLLTEFPPPIGHTFVRAIGGAAMGCVSSKAEHDAGFANVNLFQVMNVDDTGRRLCAGQLEVSDSDLILYQKGKIPVRWPLRSLRRYGFDADLFSFECGRRCPTGPGIYAFHCRRAEILFNNVQARVAARHEEQEVTVGNSRTRIRHSLPAHGASLPNGVGFMERDDAEEEGSYLEPIRLQGAASHQHQPPPQQPQMWTSSTSRPLSSSSLISSTSSPMSPAAALTAANVYANNDMALISEGEATSVVVASVASVEPVVPPPVAYANLHSSYPKLDELSDDHDSQHHLYINVGPDVVEVNTGKTRTIDGGGGAAVLKQVNYVLLDLDKGSDSTTTASVTAHPISPQGSVASFAESPQHRISAAICSAVATQTSSATVLTAEGYATIDFDRTAALSNTAASSLATEEEGLRKTRHNSTMANSNLFSLNRQTSSVSD